EYVIPAPSAFCPSSQSAFSFVALSIAGSFRSVMDRAYSKAKVVTFSPDNEGGDIFARQRQPFLDETKILEIPVV
ncbi:MAG: hypothetical protein ACFNZW_09460, partial [Coriobacteriaceae bacterium]